MVPDDSSPVILVLALNEMKNQLLTLPNKSIALEQLSATYKLDKNGIPLTNFKCVFISWHTQGK